MSLQKLVLHDYDKLTGSAWKSNSQNICCIHLVVTGLVFVQMNHNLIISITSKYIYYIFLMTFSIFYSCWFVELRFLF